MFVSGSEIYVAENILSLLSITRNLILLNL